MRYLMLIYRDEDKMNAEREKVGAEAYTGQWMAYHAALGKTGKLLGGEALHGVAEATTVRGKAGGGLMTTDGAFVETTETLGGYFRIYADNLDEVMAWAAKLPIFQTDGG